MDPVPTDLGLVAEKPSEKPSVEQVLVRQLEERPYETLLVAAGLGYVLGGGLFTPLTARVVVVGLRAAVVPLVQLGLEALARTEARRDPVEAT